MVPLNLASALIKFQKKIDELDLIQISVEIVILSVLNINVLLSWGNPYKINLS